MSELVGKNGGGGLLIYSVRKSKPIPLDLSLGAFSDLWPVGRFVLGTIHLRRPQNLLRMRTLFAFDSKTHDGYEGSIAFYFCFWGLRSTPQKQLSYVMGSYPPSSLSLPPCTAFQTHREASQKFSSSPL